MSTKTSFLFYLNSYKVSVAIFYFVFLALFAVTGIVTLVVEPSSVNFSGLEGGTAVFLLIAAMNSFKNYFLFHLQCGSSRKTMFKGWLSCAAVVSFGMMVVNVALISLLAALRRPFYLDMLSIPIENMFLRIFAGGINLFAIYLLAMMFGYLFPVSFYRLNHIGKWILGVSIGGISILISYMSAVFEEPIMRFFLFLSNHPFYASAIYLLTAAVFALADWLLVRNIPAKVD